MPPANAPTKYANISGTPCITYLNSPIDTTEKYDPNVTPPNWFASDAMFVLMKFPMATPITDAFHININIAPAPYKNENKMQNRSTLTLLKNILLNMLNEFIAFPVTVVAPESCVVRPFIEDIVDDCDSKIMDTVDAGSTTYHNTNANVAPKNKYMNEDNAFACSFSNNTSVVSVKSFCSSNFISLYIIGTDAIVAKNTINKLLYSLNMKYDRNIAMLV